MSTTVSPKLIPATTWNEYHPWPPRGGLRHLIFNANTNGFDQCVRRCGRRVLIDEAAFFDWMARQPENAAVDKKGGRHGCA